MKLRTALVLLLSSGLLLFGYSFVNAEGETVLTTTGIIKDERGIIQVTRKVEREAFQEALKNQREERKTKIEEIKADFKTKREEFKTKMGEIRDERKKQLVERIDNRMSTVNKNQTDRMIKALSKLTEHINKLEGRGVDVTFAKKAISTAQTAVEAQAKKDYTFTITDEKNLGTSVKASYDLLKQDLKSVQALLVKAKEAVVEAYKTAKSLKKITPTPTMATP